MRRIRQGSEAPISDEFAASDATAVGSEIDPLQRGTIPR
jgi:hypothetical protein